MSRSFAEGRIFLFFLLDLVFSFVLANAILETYFPSNRKTMIVLVSIFVVGVGIAVLAYSIAMIVNFGSKAGTLDPVPDFSRLVVVSCDLAYALLLETSLVIAAFNLARTESNPVVRSRLLIFLGATTLLLCLWTVAVVLTCLYYTVDVSAFGKPMLVVISTSELITGVCICVYCFFATIAAGKSKEHALVQDQSKGESSVPLMYRDY